MNKNQWYVLGIMLMIVLPITMIWLSSTVIVAGSESIFVSIIMLEAITGVSIILGITCWILGWLEKEDHKK